MEIRRTGSVPEIPNAVKGDFDHRVLMSPLQKVVTESKRGAQ